MATKKRLIIIIISLAALALLIFLIFFIGWLFQPIFLRHSYLERITRLEIPRTARIVEYQFGITSAGAEPFFAKLELSQEDYDALVGYFVIHPDFRDGDIERFQRMKQNFDYSCISIDDIVEIGWRDILTSRPSYFAGWTRQINTFIISTIDGKYFLYVSYR